MISVLMRSHNDMLYIRRTVEALLEQETDMPVEIISCDDRSTDGTAEYLAGIPQLRRIAPPEGRYVPGKTLNHMVRQARGEYIVFNNGDAIPLHKDYLKNLTAPLKEKSVDCVFGNQIARPEAFAVVRKDYERAFGDGSVSCKWHQFFSLVSSGFRKEELTENPFDETFQYSEDSQWVNRRSVKIDNILTHKYLAIPIFLGIMGVGLFMATIYTSALALGTKAIRGNDLGVSTMILIGSAGGIITPLVVGLIAQQGGIQAGMAVVVVVTALLLGAILFAVKNTQEEE